MAQVEAWHGLCSKKMVWLVWPSASAWAVAFSEGQDRAAVSAFAAGVRGVQGGAVLVYQAAFNSFC